MNKKNLGIIHFLPLILIGGLIIVIIGGILYFNQNSQKPLVTKQESNEIVKEDWRDFYIDEIGMQLSLPSNISLTNPNTLETEGYNGKGRLHCWSIGENDSVLINAVQSCPRNTFSMSAYTRDIEPPPRGVGFTDNMGYEEIDGQFFVGIDRTIPIPNGFAKKITISDSQIDILRVNGVEGRPSLFAPDLSKIGAIINLKNPNSEYKYITVEADLSAILTPEIFDQILSTFEFVTDLKDLYPNVTEDWDSHQGRHIPIIVYFPPSWEVVEENENYIEIKERESQINKIRIVNGEYDKSIEELAQNNHVNKYTNYGDLITAYTDTREDTIDETVYLYENNNIFHVLSVADTINQMNLEIISTLTVIPSQ